MSKANTPFHKGQQAYHAGAAIEANPHGPNHTTHDPEGWPWDHANWRDGWKHAQSVAAFTENHHDRMKHKEQKHA
jgi:hypothetical protein